MLLFQPRATKNAKKSRMKLALYLCSCIYCFCCLQHLTLTENSLKLRPKTKHQKKNITLHQIDQLYTDASIDDK